MKIYRFQIETVQDQAEKDKEKDKEKNKDKYKHKNREKKSFISRNIVSLISLLLAGVLATIFIADGFSESGLRHSLSATGRISYPIFILLFTASSIHKLFPSQYSQWVYSNRKELGLTFSITYLYHCIGFFGLYYLTGNFGIEGLELILSIISYVFIVVMTLTSFSAVRRRFSPWLWNSVHTFGMYMYWYFFLQEFIHRAEESSQVFYYLFAVVNAIILGIRIIASSKPTKVKSAS